jgi:hypothetical protein
MTTRLHPYDFVFEQFDESNFRDIRDEAGPPEELDLSNFAKLSSVHRSLQEMGAYEMSEHAADALAQYMTLLFVAFRYWRAGRHTVSPKRAQLEAHMSDAPGTPPAPPHDALYISLPEQLFWAQTDPEAPHEPIEGMFVTFTAAADSYTVAAVLGLRPERHGFSQLSVTAGGNDLVAAPECIRQPPFEPIMEGGTQAGFHSVTSEAELLQLARVAMESATQ